MNIIPTKNQEKIVPEINSWNMYIESSYPKIVMLKIPRVIKAHKPRERHPIFLIEGTKYPLKTINKKLQLPDRA